MFKFLINVDKFDIFEGRSKPNLVGFNIQKKFMLDN